MISLIPVKNNNIPQFRGNLVQGSLKAQADTFMQEGYYDRAIELYKKFLASNPQDADANLNLAKTYSFNNQFKEAIPHLEVYVAANPQDIENITFLGECYKKSGSFSKFPRKALLEAAFP